MSDKEVLPPCDDNCGPEVHVPNCPNDETDISHRHVWREELMTTTSRPPRIYCIDCQKVKD